MSQSYRRIAAIVLPLLVLTFTTAARADDTRAKDAQAVISAQIDAFLHDDGAKAYSFASSDVQRLFPNVDIFMNMVRSGYAPVYHPRQFQFGPFAAEGDMLRQTVELTAADGTAWTAEYTLAKAADGSLRITSCHLAKKPGIGA